MTLARAAAVTDTGRRRRRNEDAYVCDPPLFVIADGMGGAQAGEIASHIAATSAQHAERNGPTDEQGVVQLIQDANRSVYERARADESTSGMGTTMTVALVEDGGVVFGHVGDSRAYVLRDGELEQLTDDHSLVAELVRGGKLSAEEAEHHPQRSVITRALGTDPDVDVDTFTVEGREGDVFVLCSDGLTDMVADEEIGEVPAERRESLEEAANELVRRANRAGGQDNITVVAFALTDEPDERTLEQTVEQTVEQTAVQDATEAPKPKGEGHRFLPLIILIAAIVVAAAILWVLVKR